MQLVSYLDPEDSGTVSQDELVIWHDASVARYLATSRHFTLFCLRLLALGPRPLVPDGCNTHMQRLPGQHPLARLFPQHMPFTPILVYVWMATLIDVTPGSDGSVRDVESAAAIVLSHCNYIVQFEVRPRLCRILPIIFPVCWCHCVTADDLADRGPSSCPRTRATMGTLSGITRSQC
jgi:hypothetical protein